MRSETGQERERFTFPRQRRDSRLGLADYFRPAASGQTGVVAFQLATMGPALSVAPAGLFAKNAGFFSVKDQGARYSMGYPACPDLADRAKVARLLRPERIGVELSGEMQLDPSSPPTRSSSTIRLRDTSACELDGRTRGSAV